MLCRKLFKGLLVGGLVGIAIIQYVWRRQQAASDQAVSELRPALREQPAAATAGDVSDAGDQAPDVAEVESVDAVEVETEVVVDTAAVEDSSADVRAEVIDIDEFSVDEVIEPDDLRVIEGIGPKISDILNENGILTYAQLAETDVDDLRAILTDAGSRFRLADPTTWPQQAKFAAEGDWDGLQALQQSLKGGR